MVIQRIVIHHFVYLSSCLLFAALLAGCSAEPERSQRLAVQPTASPPATPVTPTITATPATASPTADQNQVVSFITQTRTLAPWQKLQNEQIVDRPLLSRQTLTDGKQKYKTAVWGPSTDWIAAVPQDGPGLDIVHAATGEVRSVVTDTYVLEPLWLAADALLVHRVASDTDELVRITIGENGLDAVVIAADAGPLQAVGASDGGVAWTTADEQMRFLAGQSLSPLPALPINALVTSPAPLQTGDPVIAANPFVTNLENIQTLIMQQTPDAVQSSAISDVGEGLWLPRWAGDGAKLALTSIGGRIVTTTVDGAARYDLGPGDSPAWSSDNNRVAYAGTSAGDEFTSRDIHVVDWQGRGPRLRLTDAGEEELYTSPSWSPDGTRIVFVEIDSGQLFIGQVPRG